MEDFAIKVENVSKSFKLPYEKNSSIKSAVVNFYKGRKGYDLQKALDNVSFEVEKGEFLGIVGRNGSGKSTLLKLLAGIYSPTKGQVHIRGSLTPFIELGVGFNQELTGRENIFLNGALLGFNRKEMQAMYKDIVEFAELQKFMDQKLKNYSSGMQVRLAFSIAIRAQSDILLLDEVLAVGDAAFQRKCFNYFGNLKKNKRTVIFVSHDMGSVRKYCDRAILINESKVISDGKPDDIVPQYLEILMNDEKEEPQSNSKGKNLPIGMSEMVDIDKSHAKIGKIWIENGLGKKIHTFKSQDNVIRINFEIKALKPVSDLVPGAIVTNDQGEFITASNSKWGNHKNINLEKDESAVITFELPNIFEAGDYSVSVNVVSGDMECFYDWKNEAARLRINKDFTTGGKSNPRFRVEVSKHD